MSEAREGEERPSQRVACRQWTQHGGAACRPSYNVGNEHSTRGDSDRHLIVLYDGKSLAVPLAPLSLAAPSRQSCITATDATMRDTHQAREVQARAPVDDHLIKDSVPTLQGSVLAEDAAVQPHAHRNADLMIAAE